MSLIKYVRLGLIAGITLLTAGLVAGCAGPQGKMTGVSLGATGGLSSMNVKRGRTVEVGTFLHWDKNCWAATVPDIKIVKRPKYGSVSVSRGNMMIPASECKGIPIRGAKLKYRGHRRGADEFSYRVTSGPRAGVHTVRLTVK
jgi:hypothetical protein